MEIFLDPGRLGYFLGDPGAGRRGQRPVRRRHVHVQRRPAADRLPAQPARRRRDRHRHRRDRLALRRRRPALRPHGDLARRQARRRLGLDRQRRPHPRRRTPARRSAASSPATRRTRTPTPRTASGSTTPASASSTRRPTTRRSTPPRATATSRSSTRQTFEILERLDMGEKLAEAGYPEHELGGAADGAVAARAVRLLPGLLLPRLRRVRPSQGQRVTRVANLPISEEAEELPREEYLLDSAHHGIAMNGDGHAPLRRRDDVRLRGDRLASHLQVQADPRRARSPTGRPPASDGSLCYVSWSGTDKISVISYRKRKEIAEHPGRRPPAADPHRLRAPELHQGAPLII